MRTQLLPEMHLRALPAPVSKATRPPGVPLTAQPQASSSVRDIKGLNLRATAPGLPQRPLSRSGCCASPTPLLPPAKQFSFSPALWASRPFETFRVFIFYFELWHPRTPGSSNSPLAFLCPASSLRGRGDTGREPLLSQASSSSFPSLRAPPCHLRPPSRVLGALTTSVRQLTCRFQLVGRSS